MPDGRFAPSPTGPLHLGNLRTALLAWLFARSERSRFLIRIEDLDPAASRDEWVRDHLADLEALGLDHDGAVIRQSDPDVRTRHDDAIGRLVESDLVYPCWCTRREIADAARAAHGPMPEGAYPGNCAALSDAERVRAAARRPDRQPALRVRARAAVVEVRDRYAGPVRAVVDDFVVRRGDGVPAYNLAVVVDDDHQGIGEVVRGDDLLLGTPRQAWLMDVLGIERPGWTHVPLVLGPDGERLAKRHGSVTRTDLERLGFTAGDVLGMLAASLGLGGDGESVDAATLSARFDPRSVPRQPWVFVPPEHRRGGPGRR